MAQEYQFKFKIRLREKWREMGEPTAYAIFRDSAGAVSINTAEKYLSQEVYEADDLTNAVLKLAYHLGYEVEDLNQFVTIEKVQVEDSPEVRAVA